MLTNVTFDVAMLLHLLKVVSLPLIASALFLRFSARSRCSSASCLRASEFTVEELAPLARRIRPSASGSGVEEVQFVARLRYEAGESAEMAVRVSDDARGRVHIDVGPPPTEPLLPLDDYQQKVLRATRRGNAYPYQLTDLLAGPGGRFTEHDLIDTGALVPVDRPVEPEVAGG